ncbi:MAG: ABC transporter permease [Spirochaetes bacterium]|nr:MAG: ABC transporter permease [Spirochaetota bacterium]
MSGPFFTARRLFLRQRREHRRGHPLLGAALGIALSLIPLVTVDHVADAMIEGIIARYRETSSFHFQIHSWGTPGQSEWEALANDINSGKLAKSAWVERQGFGLARAGELREGLTLRSLPPDLNERDKVFASYIEFDSGKWNLDTPDSILLGREAARRLHAGVGDELRVLTARRINDGRYIPRVSRFTVRGIFTSGYQDLDRTWAFIPLDTGWSILSSESSKTFIGGKLSNPAEGMEDALLLISSALPDRWIMYDWKELNRYLLSNLENTRNILLFIMALIILVAVFNVMSSLIMLTLERKREIGILKCTGSSPSDITKTFVFAGMLASAAGTITGLAGGLLVSRYVNQIIFGIEAFLGFFSGTGVHGPKLLDEGYYLQYIPVHIRWKATAVIGIATFLLSLAASYYPASRAAKLKPLDVLRKH